MHYTGLLFVRSHLFLQDCPILTKGKIQSMHILGDKTKYSSRSHSKVFKENANEVSCSDRTFQLNSRILNSLN